MFHKLKTVLVTNKEICVLLLIAAVLRIVGFWHGFPFIFHPDEPAVIRSAIGIRFDPNPGHFDWPHLHFYLNYLLIMGFDKARALVTMLPSMDFLRSTVIWRDPIIFYMLGRLLDGLLGTLTLLPIYLAGKELAGKRAGLFAAALFAVMPFHVRVSHFALVDVPAVFWMSWGVYFSYKVLRAPRYLYYAVAGLFFGLAMSTKYNGLVGALSLVTVHLVVAVRHFRLADFIVKPLVAIGGAFFGFVLGTPFAVLDYSTFTISDSPKGALWQFTNVGSVPFLMRGEQFFTQALAKLSVNTGFTPLILALCAVADLVRKAINKDNVQNYVVTLVPFLVIVFYVAGYSRQQAHYYLPAYPFIALSAGLLLASFTYSTVVKKLLLGVCFAIPLFLSLGQVITLSRTDTRVLAYNYLVKTKPETNELFYNSIYLEPLIEKLTKTYEVEQVKNYNDLPNTKGGLWLVQEPANLPDLPRVTNFSNRLRNGPTLYIFKIDAN